MNKYHKNSAPQEKTEKTRTIISKSPQKGTEMVVYRFKQKGRMVSETRHEVVAPKIKQVKKALHE